MDTDKRQVSKWFMVSASVTLALLIVGVVMNPDSTINAWKIAAAVTGGAGLIALVVTNNKKEK